MEKNTINDPLEQLWSPEILSLSLGNQTPEEDENSLDSFGIQNEEMGGQQGNLEGKLDEIVGLTSEEGALLSGVQDMMQGLTDPLSTIAEATQLCTEGLPYLETIAQVQNALAETIMEHGFPSGGSGSGEGSQIITFFSSIAGGLGVAASLVPFIGTAAPALLAISGVAGVLIGAFGLFEESGYKDSARNQEKAAQDTFTEAFKDPNSLEENDEQYQEKTKNFSASSIESQNTTVDDVEGISSGGKDPTKGPEFDSSLLGNQVTTQSVENHITMECSFEIGELSDQTMEEVVHQLVDYLEKELSVASYRSSSAQSS